MAGYPPTRSATIFPGMDLPPPDERLLRPTEVARLFQVDPKTVTRWVNAGKLPSYKTPGGHHRIPESAVRAFLPPA